MVQYNAFNVDPLRYQQAGMNNVMQALQHRDNVAMSQDRNALYEKGLDQRQTQFDTRHNLDLKQHEDTQGYRKWTQEQAGENKKAEESRHKQRLVSQGISFAIQSPDPRKALEIFAAGAGGAFDGIDFSKLDFDGLKGKEPGVFRDKRLPGMTFEFKGTNEDIARLAMSLGEAEIKSPADMARIAAEHGVGFEQIHHEPKEPKDPKEYKPDVFSSERAKQLARSISEKQSMISKGTKMDEAGYEVPLTPQEISTLQNEIGIETKYAKSLATGDPANYPSLYFGNMRADPEGFAARIETAFELGQLNHPEDWVRAREWLLESRKRILEREKASAAVAELAAKLNQDTAAKPTAKGRPEAAATQQGAAQPSARPKYGAEQEGGTIVGGVAKYFRDRAPEAKKSAEEYRANVMREVEEARKLGLTLQQYRELIKE